MKKATASKEEESKPVNSNGEKAQELCRRWTFLQAELTTFKTIWQEIADFFMPRKAGIITKTTTPNVNKESQRFDSSPQQAVQIMAGGLMSWLTPSAQPWFSYNPIRQLRDVDRVKAWMAECTEVMQEVLANSNFYTEAHEDMLNHCTFATSALYSELIDGELRFEALPTGTYAIEENASGVVDTLFREFEFTARQAADKFEEETLPPKIREALKSPEKAGSKFRFLHAVYPRPESERGEGVYQQTKMGKPFASCYVELGEKWLVQEGGYDTFPFQVGRYLKWGTVPSVYGYGPGFGALPEARQGDYINMVLDVAAEKIVNPSMLAPAELDGNLILSAGGITYVNSAIPDGRWPKPIEQNGDYSVAQERVNMRKKVIESWFHVDLFNMFASLDQDRRQMTAFEVSQRISQKVELIEPAYSRIANEKHTPMLKRLFGLLMEAGMLPPPPPEAVVPVSQFMGYVPPPVVAFTSRMALMIASRHNRSFEENIELDIRMMQFDPSALDDYNLSRIRRDRARNNGVPVEWMRSEEDAQKIGQARAQAQQAQQQMQMLAQGAQAAGGLSKAAPAIQQMMGGGQ